MSDSALRYFTLEEANATLPYVRSIVTDVVSAYAEWREHVAQYEVMAANSRSDLGETETQVELRTQVDRIAKRIGGYLSELEEVGCTFKGLDDGLVDFLSVQDGRDVFLCWKLGEPEISHWHELDAGFAGRQLLAPEFVSGDSR
jgi:hypothetical protein